MKTLRLENISKRYKKNIILNKINYTFTEGNCYMVLGENGSGKSTLLKMILNLIYPTSGIIISDFKNYTYIPEKIILPLNVTVLNFLTVLCEIKKVSPSKINYFLDFFEISFAINYKLKQLSKGMLQKVLITQALLSNSEVYIFDEVLNGLDKNMQNKFLNYIKSLKSKNALIIITSHYSIYYEDIVDKKIYIKDSKIYEYESD